MSVAAAETVAERMWTEEPASQPGRARIRARIGGLHCSLCTSTIEKALSRRPGDDKVAVSAETLGAMPLALVRAISEAVFADITPPKS